MNLIEITITGTTATGKSAVFGSIREMLEGHGYCVAAITRSERLNPPESMSDCAYFEKPEIDKTVFVIHEVNIPKLKALKETA